MLGLLEAGQHRLVRPAAVAELSPGIVIERISAADLDAMMHQRKEPQGNTQFAVVLLSSAILMNRASTWAGQARDVVLDGVIAVPDDRGVTQSTTCRTPSPGTGRLESE